MVRGSIRFGIASIAITLIVDVHASDVDSLIQRLSIRESVRVSRDMHDWFRPKKIAVLLDTQLLVPERDYQDRFREAADGVPVLFLDYSAPQDGFEEFADADIYIGWCRRDVISTLNKAHYIHIFTVGLDRCMTIPGFKDGSFVLTNGATAASATIAESCIAMMLALTRNLHRYRDFQHGKGWVTGGFKDHESIAVEGKTMLVLGLGGIGTEVAKRANSLGMRVVATRNSSRYGPDFVEYVGLSHEAMELAAQSDVVVNALPLTETTRRAVNRQFFDNMKTGSYYISIGRGPTTDTEALVAALADGTLRGAALDVTDPEPLPPDHELWQADNVIITPHVAADSDRAHRNMMLIAIENLRRYVQGEKLLNPIDLSRGY